VTRDELLRAFETRITHPVSVRECLQLLKVPREERVGVRRQLRALSVEGALVQVRGHRFGLPGRMDLVVGRLAMHPDGYGFVVPEPGPDAADGDVYVAPAHLEDAMHGDRVVVRVEHRRTDRRREGRIIQLLERANAEVVGRYEEDASGFAYVVPHERRLVLDIHIPAGERRTATPGAMVVTAITRWPTATRGPLGRVVEVLGRLDDPGVDTRVVIRKYGIPDEHGADALAEAARCGDAVRDADLAGRTDFRAWLTVTIDGEDARDFDDAISLERLPNGHAWLGVHIADVSHYVTDGSALDDEARERGTSVYFPERAVHMLPAGLAAGLCSLKPGVDRLVQSCLMEVNADGTVVRHEFHDGVIRSAARMTYTQVNAMLTVDAEGHAETRAQHAALVPLVERMRDAFEVLHARRRRRGAIDFDLPQPEIVLDAAGLIEAILPSERNVAHRIIEEFMLLANETVATYMNGHDYPTLYRVHEAPDPFKVEEFAAFVTSLGFGLPLQPGGVRPRDFQRLIERVRGAPEEKPIAFLLLRTMQLARYEAVNRGHFGLALETYTHFTSPIRRYPDLIVHRTLRLARRGALTGVRREEFDAMLPDIGRQSSARERRAMEAERELVQWKKARFMADKIGDEFDGVVTGVAAFGLFVELIEHFVEGLIHVSTLADDYYRFVEPAHQLRGENTRRVYRLGDRVRVQVLRVDLDRRQIELGMVEVLEQVRRARRVGMPVRSKVGTTARRSGASVGRRRTKQDDGAPRTPQKRPGGRRRR
jgi:ribonuclease R